MNSCSIPVLHVCSVEYMILNNYIHWYSMTSPPCFSQASQRQCQVLRKAPWSHIGIDPFVRNSDPSLNRLLGLCNGKKKHMIVTVRSPTNYYPLVNVYIAMENHHFFMGKSTISMAIFNSYFDITRG